MKNTILALALILSTLSVQAQLGIGTIDPEESSILHLESNSKGLLPPRLTDTDKSNISNPVAGLVIYNTSINRLEVYDGNQWISIREADRLEIETKSTDFTITGNKDSTLFLIDDAALVSLPPLADVGVGFRVYLKRKGFGNVSIQAANTETIEGVASIGIGFQGGIVEIVSTASQWELLRSSTASGGGNASDCPTGSISYTSPGASSFTVTQAMVDNCIFSIQVKGAAGANQYGGAGGGIAFNWQPTTTGTLGVFVGGGGSAAGSGGTGGGGGGGRNGGGGASAVKFETTVLAIAGGGGGSGSTSARAGGAGGSIGSGNSGTGSYPGGGAPGNGTGGVSTVSGTGNGGNAGANGANGNVPAGGSGVPSFSIGGGGGGFNASTNSSSGGGGGGGYGGGAGGRSAGGGGGAGFLLSDSSITNGTSITGGQPTTTAPQNGENGSVTITISAN